MSRQSQRKIKVRGAAAHNLRNMDIDIPRDQLVVVTGVSGSGKSSLAFDTIFAEGQRKYMESLSSYARQFLQQMQKPDVERIEGLPPTIAIQQRAGSSNPRSTVATTTEIYDYMRLLMARCGRATCWAVTGTRRGKNTFCGNEIASTDATQIVNALLALDEGTRLMIAAPVVRGKKGFHKEILESLQKQGFVRARVNSEIIDLRDALKEGGDNPLNLGRYEQHSIEAVIDRIAVRPDARSRLADSIEVALRLGDGMIVALVEGDDGWEERNYSEKLACPEHPECSMDKLEPRLFSFNSPFGACRSCDGLGVIESFDPDLVIPDPSLSLGGGAIAPWTKNGAHLNRFYGRLIRRFCDLMDIDRKTAVNKLPKAARDALLNGIGTPGRTRKRGKNFEGILPNLQRRYLTSESDYVKDKLRQFMSSAPCPACGGERLRPEALAVKLSSGALTLNIAELTSMTINQAIGFFDNMDLSKEQQKIAKPILREIASRLSFLAAVGLEYLTLDRRSGTLSGGEAQRIRLATQVGSGLVGVCYVLDEPTIGLHQRDNDRLIQTMRDLADIGNTVLVVEHDEGMIRAADHVIDIGPGPGRHGGTVIAAGSCEDVMSNNTSITGAFLSGKRTVETPPVRRTLDHKSPLKVKGAKANNLKNIEVEFPLGGIICVTGVSGSGKSTLVNEILLKALRREVHGSRTTPGAHSRLTGLRQIDRVVEVDQSPIGRTPRSNPATYTSIFDDVRRLYAQSRESRIRGYQPGRFSFNVKGGRCEACQGQGVKKIEMHFLPDVYVTCEVCQGQRYNHETLEILYRHKSIADVLDMTVEDGIEFFQAHDKLVRMLTCLHDVGLDYIQLGQPSTTLSGGEAQRIKLASELGQRSNGHTLYALDEPTTGLHFADVEKLLSVFQRLADANNTLVVIEHNLDVIKCADWVIDLGPEGGDKGGTVVASGTPEDVAKMKASHTGRYLRPLLKQSPRKRKKKPTAV